MSVNRFRLFSLEQANRVVPALTLLTETTRAELDALREGREPGSGPDDEILAAATRAVLDRWARAVLDLGGQPKGIFTVDFRTVDPNVLWCWSEDETSIGHRHFTWESFKDRVTVRPRWNAWPGMN